MRRPPYYTDYGRSRLLIHNVVTSKYFDLAIAAVIGLNVVTMAMEFYRMPPVLKKMILFKHLFIFHMILFVHWITTGIGGGLAHFQLLLHCCFHHRISL